MTSDKLGVNREASKTSLYFNDGERNIDFVLVWRSEETTKLSCSAEHARSRFLRNLVNEGIELEEDIQESSHFTIHYIKMWVPWEAMCIHAEALKLRVPLQIQEPDDKSSICFKLKRWLHFLDHRAPNTPFQYITCPFRRENIQNYLGCNEKETFFTVIQRHQVAYRILATTEYGDSDKGQVGIDRLVEESIFSAVYPMNEGPFKSSNEMRQFPENLSRRQILYLYWARWGCWFKRQPLDHIRDYYGENIAFYFAWLGCYTQWLLPAGIVGLLCFIYGVSTVSNFVPAREVCDSRNPIRMCPYCEEAYGCEYWYLHNLCMYRQISYLFDHPGTLFFSVFMVAWAVLFMETWKRKCSNLAYRWDVFDYELEEEAVRPQYASLCTIYSKNPVTGQLQPFFKKSIRKSRILIGVLTSMLLLTLVVIFLIAVIIYRCFITMPLFRNPALRSQASLFASITGGVMNLILIMTLGRVYEKLAYKMTQWEMHETQSAFEKYLTVKVFLFQFVNYYASIFYIAFFKGKFVGHPGAFATFLGIRNEACAAGGCLVELAQQLLVIMVGKQIISNFQEIVFPKLKSWFRARASETNKEKQEEIECGISMNLKQYMEDYKLVENDGLFEEYLEMVIQFGFITIFVAAFPLAPLFALFNNWLEIRIDAHKFVCDTRRPVAQRSKSIGIWFYLMEIIVGISIVTNAFIIAFTSEFLPKLLYSYEFDADLKGYTNFTLVFAPANTTSLPCMYQEFRNRAGEYTMFHWKLLVLRLGFVIIFEHIAFLISRLLDIIIPDIPKNLDIALRRERFLARQATAGIVTSSGKIRLNPTTI